MALTFAMQGVTGAFMLLYYTPTPTLANVSTMYIINSVPLGLLVETLHLYTAYAMILLTFMHLARNYFGSSHKRPRELMWVAGVIMMIIVLSFGVTGYLLPWTVLSKSATDVAIGIAGLLPGPFSSLGRSFLVGVGSDEAELTRFFGFHTILLPLSLIAFLAAKIYMFEVHGPSYVPAYGKAKKSTTWPWFFKIFFYAVVIFSLFIALLLSISALFPLSLPPAYSPETAAHYVAQPDWYLLSVYQLLKFDIFEGSDAVYAIGLIGVFLLILILLPFYDRSTRRMVGSRPLFATLGAIAIVEYAVLSVWGYLTPGQIIDNVQAVAVVVSIAALVALLSLAAFRFHRKTEDSEKALAAMPVQMADSQPASQRKILADLGVVGHLRLTAIFIFLLTAGSASLASVVNGLLAPGQNVPLLTGAASVLCFSTYVMCRLVRKVVLLREEAMRTVRL